MKTCLFCRNTRIFNIHNDYGNSSHTAKDDMLQFFGYQIESHLRPDDAICNLCMNIMDNVAKLKRRLLPLIFRSEPSYMEDCKPINFGKKWDVFASMNFEEEDPFLESRSPTPSNLLKCKRIVPYESPIEMKIAEIERHRSLSRTSVAKSEAESEIVNAFSKKRARRRKRGHNWSRRKTGRYSSASTNTRRSGSTSSRRTRSRPVSTMSIMSTDSYESFYPPAMNVASPAMPRSEESSLRYLDGCLQNKRTRSVSKRQEEEIQLFFKEDELYECGEEDCSFISEDIDVLAQHKISRHRQLALFWCNFCGKKYTSGEDLEIHKRTHSEQYACVICHKEFYYDRDLLDHWQEHVKKSVPCKICGKRRKIPSRIDYDKVVESNSKQSNGFEVRILVQDGVSLLED